MSPSGRAILVGATTVAIGTFVARYLAVEFTNDHFVHLSRAWQIVLGDVPDLDFFDPGLILQYYASAAALLLSGHNLFGEALLTMGFIAAGAGLTWVAAVRVSGSLWIAAAATTVVVLWMPRLYNYPKVFLYVLAIVVAWHYAQRPGPWAVARLGVVTAVAFLFRHDHGVYIGLAVLGLLVVRHGGVPGQALHRAARFALVTVALLSPFLLFVQATVGLVRYASGISPQVQGVASARVNRLPVTFDHAAPLVTVVPPAGPRVNVRWAPDIDADARQSLERRHALTAPVHVEDTTWNYMVTRLDPPDIGALIADPAVTDTHGIDRARRTLDVSLSPRDLLQNRVSLLRVRVLPGLFSPGNALAWSYYVTLLLPFASLALLVWLMRLGRIDRATASVVAMSALLSVVIVQTLVRGSPDSRLADVAGPICVLGAWLSARSIGPGTRASATRVLRTAAVSAAWLVTAWAAGTSAEVVRSIDASRLLAGPSAVAERAWGVTAVLRSRPIDSLSREDEGLPGLTRYLFECTAPTDRAFVTWFAPRVFFEAERAFAGGQVYLTHGWHSSPEDQQLTVERLARQRVPIVIDSVESAYEEYFPIVATYMRERFVEAVSTSALEGYRVLVDRQLTPTGTYEPLGLPCYR